ncbi:SHOCT domain-containing protein [Nocardia veterana]|uniref:SHOCT domain-containing protein n=2 Tax=Nocardia veterana TaxID=132249 RepID=A0A7X6M1G6_9NOCA|nr:SHOCT domain-containing protein [Nocardia veterana]
MMMWYGTGLGGWGYGLMVAGMLIFWVLVVAAIVALLRYSGRPDPAASGRHLRGPSPQQILAERFARGEIDDEEYTRRLRVLGP